MTDDRIEELNHGYDLDAGGYNFERLDGAWVEAFDDSDGIVSLDAGFDYFPPGGMCPGINGMSCAVVLFEPTEMPDAYKVWPKHIPQYKQSRWGQGRYRLQHHGVVYETDHDCLYCEGREGDDTCQRCHGDGSVVSYGGNWAVYALED